jgi:outer membrane receptor protein involved in Fe transport
MVIDLLALAAVAAAQDTQSTDSSNSEPEIVVTGERVNRSLKETASSVDVTTARELEAMPVDRVDQLLELIPNVQVGNGSQGPAIRGQDSTGVLNNLAAFLGGARPRATLEVDGRAAGFQEFVFGTANLWDVRQVEVFRSPLTVTHGRNSIGGGIVVRTNDPSFFWEQSARVIAGNFSTRQASAATSGPIAEDVLAFRLTGDFRNARTTVDLADVHRGADPNDDDYYALRLKVLAEPRGADGLKVVTAITKTYSQRPQSTPIAPPFHEREWPFGGYGIFGVHVTSGTIHATQQLDSAQIEAIASIGRTRTRRYAAPGFGEARAKLTDISGEVFGHWNPAQRVTVRGGIHALYNKFNQRIDLLNFMGSVGDFDDRQHSFGVFAETEVAITDRLSASAGGRYQKDRQERTGGLVGLVTAPIVFEERFSAFLPKMTVSYAVTEQLKTGLLVQKAYNPGGATLDFDTGGLDTFDAERLWDYEFFVKGDLPGGVISVGANLFYNDIRNGQRGVLVPFITPDGSKEFLFKFNNVPKASTYGAEVELRWRPSPFLSVAGGVGLLKTRIKSGVTSDGDLIGGQFERSPHFTGSAQVDWNATRRLRLSAQLRHHSSYFSNDFETPELRVGPATTVDARVAWSAGRFTLFGYARNVFDSFNTNYWYDPESIEADDPRTVGFGLEARF